MKPTRHLWSAEEKRRYVETWLAGLPALVAATSKPLACLAIIIALATGQPEKVIQWLLKPW